MATRTCPHCLNQINIYASACEHCTHTVRPGYGPQEVLAAIAIILVMIIWQSHGIIWFLLSSIFGFIWDNLFWIVFVWIVLAIIGLFVEHWPSD